MLLVLVEEVVEYLLVQQGNAFEVVAGAGFKRDDLVDESVRVVRKVRDVLLTGDFLLNVGGIVSDLQLNGV